MRTSEDRREAAKRLREYGRDALKDGSLLKTLKDVTGADSWRNVLLALAELIDPTCHNQHPRASDGCFCCSECIFLYEPTDWSCRNSFLYCPRCGARVVEG